MSDLKPVSLVSAIQQHLSLPGEKLKVADIKALTADDRDDLTRAFEAMGQKILRPNAA